MADRQHGAVPRPQGWVGPPVDDATMPISAVPVAAPVAVAPAAVVVTEPPATDQAAPAGTPAETSPAGTAQSETAQDGTAQEGAEAPAAKSSLEGNAIALMAATAITSLVGFGFWAVAAKLLPAAEVGKAQAIINSATMLASLASSNVGILFGRVLASAGERSRKLVLFGYGAATAVSVVLGAGFVILFPHEELFASWADRAWFPLFVVLLSISTLQDWVLIGLRLSKWTPVEQLVFAVSKLGLLLAFATLGFSSGIVLAWAIPCFAIILVINPILFLRALPRRPPPAEGTPPMPSRKQLRSIFLAEYATGAVTVIVPLMLPLIVVWKLGTEANAYYSTPWLIAEAFSVLIWNISSSYVVEASHDRRKQLALMKRTFLMSYLVGGAGVAGLLLLGPWVLSILGPAYADQGSNVLRLAALAIPFTIITIMFINTARVRNKMSYVVALELFTAVLVITLALVLTDAVGITGAALAFLISQAASALVVIVPLIRYMRQMSRENDTTPPDPDDDAPTEILNVGLVMNSVQRTT